ncbi:hypothetical protein ACWF0M_26945 [Kribbella sp. NPDC055110]
MHKVDGHGAEGREGGVDEVVGDHAVRDRDRHRQRHADQLHGVSRRLPRPADQVARSEGLIGVHSDSLID